jgi:uncharacterized membrane protein
MLILGVITWFGSLKIIILFYKKLKKRSYFKKIDVRGKMT